MKHLKQAAIICIFAIIIAAAFAACAQTQTVSGTPAAQTDFVQMQTITVMEVYKKILFNEMPFYDEDGSNIYLRDLNYRNFVLIDMNMYKDGIPELVLQNTSNGDNLVLHYYDGVVYGKEYSFRSMGNLKIDGFFLWSNSAYNSGIGVLHITGRDQEFIHLAEYGSLMEETEMYRVRGTQGVIYKLRSVCEQ